MDMPPLPPTPLPADPAAVQPSTGRIFQRLDRSRRLPYPLSYYVRRGLWNVVRVPLFHWSNPRWFGWRRWLLRRFGAKVADTAIIYPSVRIFHPWLFEIGEWTTLARSVVIYNLGPVTIGSHTVISQETYVCAGSHDYTQADLPLTRPPILIGSGVWIAAQAFIGPGVTVGDNAVIGARAVAMRDVPAGMVVGGNPARVIKVREMKDGNG